MEMKVRIDGVEREVDIAREGSGYTVTMKGKTYDVSDVRLSEGLLAFLVDRRSVLAHVSNSTGETVLSIGGRNHRIMREELDTDLPGGTHGAGGDGRIEAPMPGSIVSVKVAEGDSVTAGDPIVVLESMKMQNEIVAPVAGVVKKLGCSEGQQVSFGEILAVIEPPEQPEPE